MEEADVVRSNIDELINELLDIMTFDSKMAPLGEQFMRRYRERLRKILRYETWDCEWL